LPSKFDPTDSLADIIENAERIEAYIAGMTLAEFGSNGLVRDAVERCLERVCEAAHRLGADAATLMPAQPWGDIRGMGNRLRHAYDRISVDLVWNTVNDRLPALLADAREAFVRLAPPGK
jgi:uncharacterized protein with HEPN domain